MSASMGIGDIRLAVMGQIDNCKDIVSRPKIQGFYPLIAFCGECVPAGQHLCR